MTFDLALQSFHRLIQLFGGKLDCGLLIFARVFAYVTFAPIFNRKDIPSIIKLIFSLFLTIIMLWIIPGTHHTADQSKLGYFIMQLGMNAVVGAVIGFTADMILKVVYSAGSFATTQMGLSSAMMMDPTTRQQVTIMDTLFGFAGTVLFVQMGGLYWLIQALHHSFQVLPLYQIKQPLAEVINVDYLTVLSANILLIAVQLIAPLMVVTMAVDIMLGILNRTAQQIPVFQLSSAMKPAIGIAVLLATLPSFMDAMANFFRDYAQIY